MKMITAENLSFAGKKVDPVNRSVPYCMTFLCHLRRVEFTDCSAKMVQVNLHYSIS